MNNMTSAGGIGPRPSPGSTLHARRRGIALVSAVLAATLAVVLVVALGTHLFTKTQGLPSSNSTVFNTTHTRVPQLFGDDSVTAAQVLNNAGLTEESFDRDNTVTFGNVFATVPPAGAVVKDGSLVTVYISCGPDGDC
jgi:beta-lactam-binding protein with PASTA domain